MTDSSTCRICKEPNSAPSALLEDVCQACATKIAALQQQTWEESGKAGDFVAKLTSAVGIPQCGGCGLRHAAMNTVDLNGPAGKVFLGLAQAIFSPTEVLSNGIQEETDPKPEET